MMHTTDRTDRSNATLILLGAETRLSQLEAEAALIRKALPAFRKAANGTPITLSLHAPARKVISAKARAAMSRGMRAYWKARKGAERAEKG